MEACNAVEREVDKVLSKFGSINEHADRVLRDVANNIERLKKEFEYGKLSVMEPISVLSKYKYRPWSSGLNVRFTV